MTRPLAARRLTRRQFLGAAGASGIALAGAAVVYGTEEWQQEPPVASATGYAPAPPAATPDPDAPLLLITNPAARPDFSPYLAEIMRAEGLVALRSAPLERVGAAELARFPLAVLAAGPVSADKAALLRAYVAEGGALLAFRPDPALGDLFGVRHLGSSAYGDYLRRSWPDPIGLHNPGPLQVHGRYDRMEAAGARVLATGGAGDPLVTLHAYGRGTTALWAFDLAQTVALLRQGNPNWADQERDGMEGVRSSDLFVGWVDPERVAVPQADEHQRLFAALLDTLAASGPPLPRLWYFPDGAPAVLVATGDAHGSRVSHVEQVLGRVERHGGTASIYYTPPTAGTAGRMARKARWAAEDLPVLGGLLRRDDPLPTPAHVAGWRARGHELGMHPYVEAGLEQGYSAYWNEFVKYGYGPLPPTVRTHRILWHGWVDNARIQARFGLRMNLDHYHSGSAVRSSDGTWLFGYLGGTGLPMRFVAEDGALLSVYQQPTHLVDEHLMKVFDTGHEIGLDGEAAAAVTIEQVAESVRRFPAALGLQCHVDPFLLGGEKAAHVGRWLDATLEYAASQGVPILSAEHWLAFTEARAGAQAERLTWDPARRALAFQLALPTGAPGVASLLLPVAHGGATLRELRVDGASAAWSVITVAARQFAAAAVPAGRRTVDATYGT